MLESLRPAWPQPRQIEVDRPVMFDPTRFHVTETLSDGRQVEIRAQRPEDREALHAAVQRASPDTSITASSQ